MGTKYRSCDRAQAAVKLVTTLYKPRPAFGKQEKSQALPRDGSWSVRMPHVDETAKACEPDGVLCYAVLYRAGEPVTTCEWTIAFAAVPTAVPHIVALNMRATETMLRVFNVGDPETPEPAEPLHVRYPDFARNGNLSGSLVLQLIADSIGQVIDVQIVSGPDYLRLGVADSVLKWRLKPYLVNGQAIPYAQVFMISFHGGTSSIPAFVPNRDIRLAPCGEMIPC